MYRSSVTLVASPFINIFTFFFTTTCSRFNIRTQRLLRFQHTSDRIKVFHVRGVLLHSYRATEVIIKRAHVTSTAFVFFLVQKMFMINGTRLSRAVLRAFVRRRTFIPPPGPFHPGSVFYFSPSPFTIYMFDLSPRKTSVVQRNNNNIIYDLLRVAKT